MREKTSYQKVKFERAGRDCENGALDHIDRDRGIPAVSHIPSRKLCRTFDHTCKHRQEMARTHAAIVYCDDTLAVFVYFESYSRSSGNVATSQAVRPEALQ